LNAIVSARQIFRLLQQQTDVAVEALALADDAHAHVALMQFGEILADEATQQTHQIADFRRWPRPVFRAEGENRQSGNTDIGCRAHRTAQSFHATAVAFYSRQTARGRPAPVAIHDDGDMPRHFKRVAPLWDRLGRAASRSGRVAQTVMISFSLPASSLSTSLIVASVAF
jgi:hypothetical protein